MPCQGSGRFFSAPPRYNRTRTRGTLGGYPLTRGLSGNCSNHRNVHGTDRDGYIVTTFSVQLRDVVICGFLVTKQETGLFQRL